MLDAPPADFDLGLPSPLIGRRAAPDDHLCPQGQASPEPPPGGTMPVETGPVRDSELMRHPDAPVHEIMTRNVITFKAETTLEEATQVMLERRISGAPVIDASRRPVGIVSKTDLLEAWHEHGRTAPAPLEATGGIAPAATGVVVGDIMVPYLLAAPHTSSISLAAALMAFEGVHRLLVLDDSSNMVGIVTSLDILSWLAQLSGFCLPKPA